MPAANRVVARHDIGSEFVNGNSTDCRGFGEKGSIAGPAWDRNSRWIYRKDGQDKLGVGARELRSGVLYWTSENCFSLVEFAERILVIVIKLDSSRLISVNLSMQVEICDVANRWRPLSLMPGRFSRRRDCNLGGRALRVKLVKDVAGRPDIKRFCSIGSCRNVPIIARKFKVGDISSDVRCNTRVVNRGWAELRSRKRSVGSQASK
jgi:hypothetical protein